MSTNYYLRTGICKCCGRYDETHICKSFRTWHAPTRWSDEPPYERETLIATVEGWKNHLRTECESGARIYNEYGEQVQLSWFLEQAAVAHRYPYERSGADEWTDADGHLFYAGEFS